MDMKVTHTGQELLIPLTALRPSKRNARKSGGSNIRQLARSIERLGLLQSLIVTESGDGKHYEVEAGKRRLKALQYLQVKCKRLPKYHAVRCLLVPDGTARTVSLAENMQREAMLGHFCDLSFVLYCRLARAFSGRCTYLLYFLLLSFRRVQTCADEGCYEAHAV